MSFFFISIPSCRSPYTIVSARPKKPPVQGVRLHLARKLHAPAHAGVVHQAGQGKAVLRGVAVAAGTPQLAQRLASRISYSKPLMSTGQRMPPALCPPLPASWSRRAGNPAGNTALGANDTGIALQLLPDGLDRLRPAAAGVGQHKAAVIVGAVLVDVDLSGFHLLRVLSGQDAQKTQIVDADIQQRTAAQTGIKFAILPGARPQAVLTVICFSSPTGVCRKKLAQAVVQRQQPDPERLHEKRCFPLPDGTAAAPAPG